MALGATQAGGISAIARQAFGALDGGNVFDRFRQNRHVIGFALTELHHPGRLRTALGAYRDGIARQNVLFLRQQVDDITDAMRHAGTSALVVDRLVDHGTKPSIAARFMRRLGRAHEADSNLARGSAHRVSSERMDLHNNDLGIATALAHRANGAPTMPGGEQALEGAVLRSLADGKALVLDSPTAPVRPSTRAELAAVLRDPSVIA